MEELHNDELEQEKLIQQLRDATTTDDKLRIVDEWNKKIEDTNQYYNKENEIAELKKTITEIRNIINEGNGRLKYLLRM